MRLVGVDCQVPSNKIANEDIIEMVRFYSGSHYNGSLPDLEILIRRFLKLAGSNTRFWRADNDEPVDLIQLATDRALRMARIKRNEIGLLIYSGIDRGFIEPSNASFICKVLGIKSVRSFDIVDACMGWSSAVQTAYSFLTSDPALNYVMIINSEFPMDKNGTILPENFTIRNKQELDWKSPSFTLGEAISVCIFKKDGAITNFEFIEDAECANLCFIPLINFKKYISLSDKLDHPEMKFYSDGAALLEQGIQPSIKVLQKLLQKLRYHPKFIFPHSVSHKVIQQAIDKVNPNLKAYSTFTELGNVATASIPSAITKALLNGIVSEGDSCVAWVASAGMKFSALEIHL